MDTALLAALVAALALTFYVLLDGFDLGVGALLLFARDEPERDLMVESIAPVWDGNETWLIMAGVTLLGCLPYAYGILLPAFYLPLLIMLWSLGCRGVSFEFRFQQQERARRGWDRAFGVGSIVAAACQGLVLGGLVQGVAVTGRSFAGGPLDWLSPVGIATAALVVAAYALTGAGWLIWRSEGALLAFSQRNYRRLLIAVVALAALFFVIAFVETPIAREAWREHTIRSLATAALFVAALAMAAACARGRDDVRPFIASLGVVATGLIGLAPLIWPYAVPYQLTIWEAAAPPSSRLFLLIGVIFLMPVVLGYSAFAYWVFRGKTKSLEATDAAEVVT